MSTGAGTTADDRPLGDDRPAARTAPATDATVVVVGAGPVGLTAALRFAGLGVDALVLERGDGLRREGSKALCMQRETLEAWQRVGVGQAVADRGVSWSLGRTYFRDRELFETRLPHSSEHFPPFVNVSQTEVEDALLARADDLGVDVGWSREVSGLEQDDAGVTLHVTTPDGPSQLRARYVVAADGVRSRVRDLLGLEFPGHTFPDRFLIADVRADLPFPDERRFWFDPPFNPGRTVLVHPQPDGVWRIDWQVPATVDVEEERRSGALDTRVRAVVGDADYELVWLTSYLFSQRLVERMRVGRVFLAGDAAHQMSPFGARGMNSGVADVENLAWKLAAVSSGAAPEGLLDSYDAERHPAAAENLAVTDATMRFMVPSTRARLLGRDAVLRMSGRSRRVRARVNSGRLAAPHRYTASPVVAPSGGGVAPDAPCTGQDTDGRPVSRVRELFGRDLVALVVPPVGMAVQDGPEHGVPEHGVPEHGLPGLVGAGAEQAARLPGARVVRLVGAPASPGEIGDSAGAVRAAYAPGVHLVRPDGYVAEHLPSVPAADLASRAAAALAG